MTSLMIFSVYSLRLASEIPIQSKFLPMINLYFVFSIIYTFLGFFWFTIFENVKKVERLPFLLQIISSYSLSFKNGSCKKQVAIETKNDGMIKRKETDINVLNLIVFVIFFLVILIFNITVWVNISIT